MSALHSIQHRVTFGECDPAGIVFYPNIYGWFDRCFHDWLAGFGGHQALCQELGAVGMGLMAAEAVFRRPMRSNDRIEIAVTARDWGRKALVLDYTVMLEGHVTATGTETRGMFVPGEKGLSAGDLAPLRARLGV
ncbi:acyl-CoA thioesterase [Pararhodobacter sp.]|uniref:acyl-CoA thioesterase n=1 Tax=Pararhodobacter sp. TaxID=2127056 RepID=UPI002FE262C8